MNIRNEIIVCLLPKKHIQANLSITSMQIRNIHSYSPSKIIFRREYGLNVSIKQQQRGKKLDWKWSFNMSNRVRVM